MIRGPLPSWLVPIRGVLASAGLDAVGVADGSSFQDILPGCRSVVVFGSGGRTLWDRFVEDLAAHPSHLTEELHPLDAFARRTIEEADPEPSTDRRWVRCAADETTFVDFRGLAVAAGLGWVGRLGLVMHPEFGPWLGLRAACFITEHIPPTGPRSGDGPCGGCPGPCETACPVGAVTVEGWDVARCASFHRESDRCLGVCHSRNACPVGAEHAHDELEHHYHADRKTGRRRLARLLGIENDLHEGVGPLWGDWGDGADSDSADSTDDGASG